MGWREGQTISLEHRAKISATLKAKGIRPPIKERSIFVACRRCGTVFPEKSLKGKKFCSKECRSKTLKHASPKEAKRARKLKERLERRARLGIVEPVPCSYCAKPFVRRFVGQLICSSNCRKPKSCGCCDTEFTPIKYQRYCSDVCTKKMKRAAVSKTRKTRPSRRDKERAKRANVHYEPINRAALFAADNWTCQICGCETPEALRGTLDDRQPELDHIVPLALGGHHILTNVQTACRKCNREKGADIGSQDADQITEGILRRMVAIVWKRRREAWEKEQVLS